YDRLAWLTGFTGSAGAAVVLADEAAIFVDGRYTLQVRAQVDNKLFSYRDLVDGGPAQYILERAQGLTLRSDPKLHSPDRRDRLRAAAEAAGAPPAPVTPNPIDTTWNDRPPVPRALVHPHAEEFAGQSAAAKRKQLGETIAAEGADAAVITSPASLAWLF